MAANSSNKSVPITDAMYRTAMSVAARAGLQSRPSGHCIWAWVQRGDKEVYHRYIDIIGLLNDPSPKHYALNCGRGFMW